MQRVLVAGGRDFNDYDLLKSTLDTIEGPFIVVSGNARGADRLGERYAKEKGYPIETKRPDWQKHGRGAGFIRNEEMVKIADKAILFWDGYSLGTKNTLYLCGKYSVPYYVNYYSDNNNK